MKNNFLLQSFIFHFPSVLKTLLTIYTICILGVFLDDYGSIVFQYLAGILSMGFYFWAAFSGYLIFSFGFLYFFMNYPDISIFSFKDNKPLKQKLLFYLNKKQKIGLTIYSLYLLSIVEIAIMNYIKEDIPTTLFLREYYDVATGISAFMSFFLLGLVLLNIIRNNEIK